MSALTLMRDTLTTALPDLKVVALRAVDNVEPRRPVVMIEPPAMQPAPNAMGARIFTFTIWLLVAEQDPERAAEAWEQPLEQLLDAIDAIEGFTWTDATPEPHASEYYGVRVDVTGPLAITRTKE